MTPGHLVIDVDTHVGPAMELIYEQGFPGVRGRWDELSRYLKLNEDPRPDLGDWERPSLDLVVAPYRYDLALAGEPAASARPGGAPESERRNGMQPGILHDHVAGRLRAMDDLGVDCHVISPGPLAGATTALDAALSVSVLSSYNRYVLSYCDADTTRLKAAIQVTGADPEWSAWEIGQLAAQRCVAAVTVCLPETLAPHDHTLAPVWRAMEEADLPLLHHSAFHEAPHFPGYRDLWGSLPLARAAAAPWSAQRLLASLILGGVFDRHPRLRAGLADGGAGWLPSWLDRVRAQAEQLRVRGGGIAGDPLDYVRGGNVFVGLDLHESERGAAHVIEVVGEDVLMWRSDFPYAEHGFTASVDAVLVWEDVDDDVKRKVLSGNAERYLRLL